MVTIGFQQSPTNPWTRPGAIFGYAVAVFVTTQVMAGLVGLRLFVGPSLCICGAGLILGLILEMVQITAAPGTPPGAGGAPPPLFPTLVYSLILLVIICVIIGVAFWYARRDPYGPAAVAFAFAAALAWALSVAGTLLWTSLHWISHFRWNSWFNFFAAGFAALAAGYTPP